jgi:endogenous inhibitor of DNA gyrase (YacG/DUF329 family)
MADVVECPACGMEVEVDEAKALGEKDDRAPLACPTCGAGFDAAGNLVHDPLIGP